jgi:hypothetical protein
MTLDVFRFLSSAKRSLLRAFSASSASGNVPAVTENMTRFFFVVVEVDNEESNIRLMESTVRLAEMLQLPDGCQVRASFEISADIARVVISM